MNKYTPDVWVLVEFNSPAYGKIRKILGGWYGGYCGSDYWKLSSGNLPEYVEGDFIVFPQESGSVYRCHKDAQRFSNLTASKFAYFENSLAKLNDGTSITLIEYKNE